MFEDTDATGDAAEAGDVRDAGDAGIDVVGDAEPFAPVSGEWTVSRWTLTQAVGSLFPMFPDGGTESAECARIVRDSYRATTLQIQGADGSVSVNGSMCRASIAGDSVSINCPCGSTVQACSHELRLRRDASTMRLVGNENFVFSFVSPPYCRVSATLEAMRARGR